MRNSSVAFICSALLLALGFWHVFDDPDTSVKSAVDEFYANIKEEYHAGVQRRLNSALTQLFDELDINKDGNIERSEFKGAVVGVMAALNAVENERPHLPQLHLPLPSGGIFYWLQLIITLQLMFLVLLFFMEHLRAVIFGDIVTVDLATDYTTASPPHVPKETALHYTTPLKGWYERAKMIFFLGTGLAFLRLFLAFFFFFTACIFITFTVSGGRNRQRNPTWFKFWGTLVTFCGTMMMLSLGFSRIVTHGALAKSKDRKILVGNHVCVIEVVYLFVHAAMPSFVSRIENLSVPLFGNVCRACEAIMVNRDAAESRQKTLDTILELARNPKSSPVMIFPEGTCDAQSALFQFKRGAFEAGQPVQMVCFKYPYKHFNPTWNGRCVGGLDLIDLLLRVTSQFVNRMEVVYLPVYTPTEAERKDSVLYASHVQKMMATVLQIPTSDAVYADYVEKAKEYAQIKKSRREGSMSPPPGGLSPSPEKKRE